MLQQADHAGYVGESGTAKMVYLGRRFPWIPAHLEFRYKGE